MAKFPKKPSRGQRALQAIYDSVCQIIDYLPSLEVRGDTTTTSVSHSSAGTIIHAKQNLPAPKKTIKEGGQGESYYGDNKTIRLQIVAGQNVFSIKPPMDEHGQIITNKNFALCYINGDFEWVQLGTCE